MISDKVLLKENGFTLVKSSLIRNPEISEMKLFHENKIAFHKCITHERVFFENVPVEKRGTLKTMAQIISANNL